MRAKNELIINWCNGTDKNSIREKQIHLIQKVDSRQHIAIKAEARGHIICKRYIKKQLYF